MKKVAKRRFVSGKTKLNYCMLCHRKRHGKICEKCGNPTIPDPAIKRFPRYLKKPKAKAKKFYCHECGHAQETIKCVAHGTVNVAFTDSLKRFLKTTTRLGSVRRPYHAGLPS